MFGLVFTNLTTTVLFDHPAYLDPGSGSLILQVILAALLGGLLVLRTSWNKVKDFLGGLFKRNPGEESEDE
jgi:hypothetical protein